LSGLGHRHALEKPLYFPVFLKSNLRWEKACPAIARRSADGRGRGPKRETAANVTPAVLLMLITE
jgi:hypothetical protein